MLLGIDGGGTTCRARLVDYDGRLLGEGRAGPANIGLGVEVAAAAILESCAAALQAAGLSHDQEGVIRAGLGLAGANVPELAAAIAAYRFPFAAVSVASDAVVACLGAHGGRDGGILILGTGSQGLAFVEGRATTLGGWGFALSDGGSAAVLGHALARAALAGHEGLGPRTDLTDRILVQLGGSPSAAVLWARAARPRDYATFAPDLFTAASAGDPVGTAIVSKAAAEVDGMLDRLAAQGAGRIALLGGIAALYRDWLAPRSRARLVEPEGDALDGAILLARGDIAA